MIEVFDLQAPGHSSSTKFPTTPNRKSKDGLKGRISCLDFNPDKSGMFAAGTYNQAVGLFDQRNHQLCSKYAIDAGNGVTQVKFSPDGNHLFVASRQASAIQCWDVRQSGNLMYELNRPGKTNQRIHFDMDPTGQVLISGDQHGHVLAYDLTTLEGEDMEHKSRLHSDNMLHDDIIATATFNPAYPSMIATCSGQRKFAADDDSDDMTSDQVIDNSLRIWEWSGSYTWHSSEV
ncbi:WD40 repeat-like protein [Hesseltinella vesiculosa]|uniref:WD40 repeat-like protein n=1 Tax=Hesseltinella vesiculosa TaxID=101127 RepID=A0A1X2GP73_9FUNG|nr:WD40 repeat-like protein [Hesseltinella vesiculosa]